MKPLSQPLNLKQTLHVHSKYSLNFIALFDVLLIAFFLTLLSSRFISSPGVTLDLPKIEKILNTGIPTGHVLTLSGPNTLFFDGKIYSLQTLSPLLQNLFRDNPQPLLLKVDNSIDMQTFLTVCGKARKAGFDKIQIASDLQELPKTFPL